MPTEQAPAHRIRRQKKKLHRPDFEHWPQSWEFQVRAATDADGPAIHALVDQMTMAQGWKLPDCDWSRVAPFWYVADLQGWVIGAVQVCVSRPMSRLELLSVHQKLSKTKQAKVAKAVLARGLLALQLDGATMATGVVTGAENGFVRILERCGAQCAVKGIMVSYQMKEWSHGV